ncbi:MAG: response regulator [Chloroflexi bacterium]|nr:response regulator [Chloroflexota bacterium]
MMERNVLLVDDQRDILRLLHATLDTLNIKKLKVFESLSGEEALLLSTRYKIDLLVTDYMLPGMSGVDLMHKIRARHPEANVIFITGVTDRKMREEILNAGAQAIFDKPIPMTDFLDVVERSLGLVRTIFPSEVKDEIVEGPHARLSDLLANFRQDINAEAVFLLNDHGLVQARTGKLLDASMEVSLISTLMAIHASSLKVARHNHQDSIDSFHVFSGGDHDLLFIPVTPMYALLVAGNGLAAEQRVLETISALLALRTQVERALKSMGVTGELQLLSSKSVSAPEDDPAQTAEESSSTEMETLLVNASLDKTKGNDSDDFWDQAAEKIGKKPVNANVISQEDARKLGLIPNGN